MLRMLKVEGCKTLRSASLWVIFIVMIAISIIFTSPTFSRLPETLKSAYGMQYALEQPMSRGEYVFLRTMSDASFTAWLSVIAGALIIGMDFANRTVNNLIYAGNKRISILIVKLFYFYLSALLLSAVYPLANCIKYSADWFSGMASSDIVYVLRCVSCRALIDMAMMSFALVSAFAFRDVIRTLVCSLITIVAISQLMRIAGDIENNAIKAIIEYFPAFAIQKVMLRDTSREVIQRSMLYSAVMVMLTGISCYLFFKKADLK
ncbi:MAG: hypothetical protein J5998_01795 [Clostridia bacterium]|nr:hypothetical protein [Clostridia bacterium]